MDVNQQKSKEQDSRELGCSSSKAMDGWEVDFNQQQVLEVDISQQVLTEKEANDLEVKVDEEKKKSKKKEEKENGNDNKPDKTPDITGES